MKTRHPIIAFFLAGILGSLSFPAESATVYGETLTSAEIALLPPVCKLILVEKPNAHIDHISQKQNAALFDRPEYRMAKNAIHLHHWCRATVARQRYFSASTPQKRWGYKVNFHDDMDYVIRNMGPAWPYISLMHVEKGEMYLVEKKYAESVSQALTAIQQNPSFVRGHVLLVNVYNALGQKNKALEAATEGLKHNPASGTLKKMYDQLGGQRPYPEPYAKTASPAPKPDSDQPSQQLPPPASDEFKASDAEEAVPQPLRLPGEADTGPASSNSAAPESSPRPNKYCRFCP